MLTIPVVAAGIPCGAAAADRTSRQFDPADEVRPVSVVRHEPRTGGADWYEFDWAVEPGPWPMIGAGGVLRYPMGAYGGGQVPYEFKTVEEWWKKSDFDLVHFQAAVEIGMTGKEIAQRNIQYVLEPARRAGRKVIMHIAYTPEMQGMDALAEQIAELKNHPALWAYDAGDEPSDPDRVISRGNNFKLLRALDPEHPIFLNDIGNQKQPSLEARIAPDRPDYYSWDIYPVQSNNGVSLESGYTRNLVRICRERQLTPAYCLGNFGPPAPGKKVGREPWWPNVPDLPVPNPGGRFSTVAEMRSQVYQSVISGVKLLLWWPWGALNNGNREDLLETTYQLNREIHALTGPIYSSLEVPVSFEAPAGDFTVTPSPAVIGMAKIYRDAIYIFAANIAEKNAPLNQRTAGGAVALTGVKIIMKDVPAGYRRLMDETADVLFETAGQDARGVPRYVKEKQGQWRTVALEKITSFGGQAMRCQRFPGSLWGAEWTGRTEPVTPSKGTPWSEWEGGKANTIITDDFPPLAVRIYRIKLIPLGK